MNLINALKITLFFLLIISCGKENKEKNLKELASEVIPVKIISLQNANNTAIVNATGLVTTQNEAKYSFKIGGVINRILVDEGQSFTKGQLLASLQSTEIEAQLSQAQIGLEKAKRGYSRANNLYKDSVATLEQLQNAKTGVDIARKSVDLVAFNKKYANIYANTNGFVAKKLTNEGEIIAPGNPVLFINELKSSNHWIIKVGVSDREWASISVGQKAKITIDAFSNTNFQGIVLTKSLAADQSNGSFQIEIRILNSSTKLAVGMFAKAIIETNSKSIFYTIPYEALIEANGNKAMVFVPIKGKVKRVPIIIESFNNEQVIVKSGLENYTEIITSNSAFLNENSNIKIIK